MSAFARLYFFSTSRNIQSSKLSSKPSSTTDAQATYEALKDKRAWDLAISPAKQLPMQAFMLYMSGGGVQIFSMGIVFMLLFSPFKNVAGLNTGECLSVLLFHSRIPVCAGTRPTRDGRNLHSDTPVSASTASD